MFITHRRALFVLVVVLLALLVALPTAAQDEGPPRVGLRPDAPEYALHGPYWVGTRDMVIGEGTDRPLHATLWYPALNPERLDEVTAYAMVIKVELGLPSDWRAMIAGRALPDAAPDMADAPYPLVLYSHGFGTNRQTSAYLTEHLASYGFVVLAIDHIEMWDPEGRELGESAFERPMDIQQTIAYAEMLAGPGGEMAGLFDMGKMAVAGHSYGGYTALAAAGGQFNTEAFDARCAEVDPNSEFNQFCTTIIPAWDDLAALVGLDAVPEGDWPSWGDDRVGAVVSLAGSPLIQAEGMQRIKASLLAMVGSLDTGGEGAIATQDIFEQAGSNRKTLVTFMNADHYIFQWSCKDVPSLVDLGFFPVCTDSVWDMDRAHDLTNHFTTAFLLAELYGDEEARAALAPEMVSFPGITYEAQGF
jgi:predicted dienelactone hydrolase